MAQANILHVHLVSVSSTESPLPLFSSEVPVCPGPCSCRILAGGLDLMLQTSCTETVSKPESIKMHNKMDHQSKVI